MHENEALRYRAETAEKALAEANEAIQKCISECAEKLAEVRAAIDAAKEGK